MCASHQRRQLLITGTLKNLRMSTDRALASQPLAHDLGQAPDMAAVSRICGYSAAAPELHCASERTLVYQAGSFVVVQDTQSGEQVRVEPGSL